MACFQLHTEIDIDAPVARVWAVLVDFASYPRWNPFIVSVRGRPEVGARLRITLQSEAGKRMRFSPRVTVADPGRELRWLGRLLLPGLFDGEHRFLLEVLAADKTRLVHSESFRGLLVRPLQGSLQRDTRRGFEAMNRTLKARVEADNG